MTKTLASIPLKSGSNLKAKVELSTREFAIIECLLFHKNSFVGIERLRAEVWNDKEIDPADVRMHILKIRQKTTPEFIKSSRGLGYKIDVSKS